MSKARVVVLEVLSGHLTVAAAARDYGLSRQHIYRLLKRYHQGGLDAVDPRSRRPASNPRRVSDEVVIAVVTLRENSSLTVWIRRILHHHGLITPQPRKRPRSSYHRFQADQRR